MRPFIAIQTSLSSAVRGAGRLAALLCGLSLLSLAAMPAFSQAAPPPMADPDATPTTRLFPDCVLFVQVTDEEQLSGTYTVNDMGEIRFTLGEEGDESRKEWTVNVREKTTEEARQAIVKSLEAYLVSPQVTVVLTRLPRLMIEVRGAVEKPGPLAVSRKAALSDALVLCELKPSADLSAILITRRMKVEPGAEAKPDGKETAPARPMTKTRIFTVDYAGFLSGEKDDDPKLENGDIITIPSKPEPKPAPEQTMVRIEGEVKREAGIPYGPGLTVKDAFERAGGLKETADRKKVRLIRRATGNPLMLDADKVEADDPVYNLRLEPGDLILVVQRDRSLQFAVLGEVVEQNRFDWSPTTKVTLLDALNMAGGLKKNADKSKGLLRKGYLINPTDNRSIVFNLDKVVKGKEPNYEIEAGDAIFIMPRQRRPTFFQQLLPMLFRFLPLGI